MTTKDTGKAMTPRDLIEEWKRRAALVTSTPHERAVFYGCAYELATHLATRVKVSDADVEQACAAYDVVNGMEARHTASTVRMRAALESFAASLPGILKDEDNDDG